MATKSKKEEVLEKKVNEEPVIQSTDDEMPEPETKDYGAASQQATGQSKEDPNKVYIRILPALRTELENTVGTLGYNREIGSPEMHIQVWQIFEVLDKTKDKYLTEEQANQFISMFGRAPWNIINPLMQNIQTKQGDYFEIVTKEQLLKQAMANKTVD